MRTPILSAVWLPKITEKTKKVKEKTECDHRILVLFSSKKVEKSTHAQKFLVTIGAVIEAIS